VRVDLPVRKQRAFSGESQRSQLEAGMRSTKRP
jgi:hypothetical protein